MSMVIWASFRCPGETLIASQCLTVRDDSVVGPCRAARSYKGRAQLSTTTSRYFNASSLRSRRALAASRVICQTLYLLPTFERTRTRNSADECPPKTPSPAVIDTVVYFEGSPNVWGYKATRSRSGCCRCAGRRGRGRKFLPQEQAPMNMMMMGI